MPSSHKDRSASATQQEKRADTQRGDKGKSRMKDSEKGKHKSDEAKNLRSELNEDAFARSTGARQKEEYRSKLAVLAQARKKAQIERGESVSSDSDDADGEPNKRRRLGNGKRATTVSSDSETSGSDDDSSDSDSSGTSSSSDVSKDFIVADDQIEYERDSSRRRTRFQLQHRQGLSPKLFPPPTADGTTAGLTARSTSRPSPTPPLAPLLAPSSPHTVSVEQQRARTSTRCVSTGSSGLLRECCSPGLRSVRKIESGWNAIEQRSDRACGPSRRA